MCGPRYRVFSSFFCFEQKLQTSELRKKKSNLFFVTSVAQSTASHIFVVRERYRARYTEKTNPREKLTKVETVQFFYIFTTAEDNTQHTHTHKPVTLYKGNITRWSYFFTFFVFLYFTFVLIRVTLSFMIPSRYGIFLHVISGLINRDNLRAYPYIRFGQTKLKKTNSFEK